MTIKLEKGKPGRPRGVPKTPSAKRDAELEEFIKDLKELKTCISLNGKSPEDTARAKEQLIWQFYRRSISYKAVYQTYKNKSKLPSHINFTWGLSSLVDPKEKYLPSDVRIKFTNLFLADVNFQSIKQQELSKFLFKTINNSRQGNVTLSSGLILFNRHSSIEDVVAEFTTQIRLLLQPMKKQPAKKNYYVNILFAHLIYSSIDKFSLSKKESTQIYNQLVVFQITFSRLREMHFKALKIIKQASAPFLKI
jgi:hypothetical protein